MYKRQYICLCFITICSIHLNKVSSAEGSKNVLFNLNEVQVDSPKVTPLNQLEFVEETKRSLLRSFGLRKQMLENGNQVKKRKPHNYMLYISKEYERRYKQGLANLANTVRGCIDIGHSNNKHVGFPKLSFKFDISEIPANEILISAELKILLKPFHQTIPNIKNGIYRVTLYGVLPRQHNTSHPVLLEVQSKTLDINREQQKRWVTFTTSSFVPGIKGMNKQFIKFVLSVKRIGGSSPIDPALIGFQGSNALGTEKALLVLYTGDENDEIKSSTRRKRGASSSTDSVTSKTESEKRKRKDKRRKRKKKYKNKKKKCRRKNMIVDFRTLGWQDWLISPPYYNAYYCHGQCKHPLPLNLRPTNYATIQSIVHNMNKDFVPPVCCVPTEFDVLPILSFDGNDRTVFKIKTGLIATNCGCR